MDFPPRPPPGMVPMGMPPGMPPPYGVILPPPSVMMAGQPRPPPMPYAAQAGARIRLPPGIMPGGKDHVGPPVTVFVGNITERAQDAMIRHLLNTCGPVLSWKRVQGATGKLQAFGFCEYANPDAALRAIRVLHDWDIGDKALVVKVDPKTKDVLDDYKKQKIKKMTGKSPGKDDKHDDIFCDAAMRHEDDVIRDRVTAIIMEHNKDMMSYVPSAEKREKRIRMQEEGEKQTGPKESLDDVEMEDGKRDIIHREIDKFRETMKIREAEKEEEKKRREKEIETITITTSTTSSSVRRSSDRDNNRGRRDNNRERPPPPSSRRRRSPSRSHSRSFSPPEDRSRRSRSKREQQRRPPTRSRTRSPRSRSRSRERRSRSRRGGGGDASSPVRKNPKDLRKERELEEEEKERKKAERKARDKEASYQERLRKWEGREQKMAKDYDKDRVKESKRVEDQDREAKKLREFLEDYDDDRDDEKYYKNQKLERRLQERKRESLKDDEDRSREKDEIEEIKAQIITEGHHDPHAELQRRMAQLDGKPIQPPTNNITAAPVVVDLEPAEPPSESIADQPQNNSKSPEIVQAPEVIRMDQEEDDDDGIDVYDDTSMPVPLEDSPATSQTSNSNSFQPTSLTPSSSQQSSVLQPVPAPAAAIKSPLGVVQPTSGAAAPKQSFQVITSSRKKMDVKDVFNQDDDDQVQGSKKRKGLPPIPSNSEPKKKDKEGKTTTTGATDDKRKHIKSLIDKIPTDKAALFEYKVDWDLVDNVLMEKRIRPWVNKKIAEYIGEPEPTLTDFICSKVLAGSTPKAVLDDVQMVLDEEAEVFVVKMWRLLIYEIESKKAKAAANSSASSNA